VFRLKFPRRAGFKDGSEAAMVRGPAGEATIDARPRQFRSAGHRTVGGVLRSRARSPRHRAASTYSADGRTQIGYGHAGKPYFWINGRGRLAGYLHVAFGCADRGTVDAFHTAALAAGGRDNGVPGPRPEYHPNYYGAFVLDPDGHNVEAVCHVGE
jgi:catechol 2,3-dioxygenase-like lactoylglutathione lyase family enzyme